MKKYIVLGFILLAISLSVVTKLYLNERGERIRHQENYSQREEFSETQVSQIKLTQKEFEEQMEDSTKKLLDSLKIKPKRVIKYIKTVHRDIDASDIVVETIQKNDTSFTFMDTTGCFLIEGRTDIFLDKPITTITHKEYINTSQYFLYKGKRAKKFLFFRVGKRKMALRIVPECGEESIEIIEVIKK